MIFRDNCFGDLIIYITISERSLFHPQTNYIFQTLFVFLYNSSLSLMDGLTYRLPPNLTNDQKLSSHSKSDISLHLVHQQYESMAILAASPPHQQHLHKYKMNQLSFSWVIDSAVIPGFFCHCTGPVLSRYLFILLHRSLALLLALCLHARHPNFTPCSQTSLTTLSSVTKTGPLSGHVTDSYPQEWAKM